MFSICVKFKPDVNWRPYCRQFETIEEVKEAVQSAFDKWPVKHACVFSDGVFLQCYFMSPKLCAGIRHAVQDMRHNRQKLYGNYNFR